MQTRISNVSDLLHGVAVLKQSTSNQLDVNNIVFDSRKANKDSLFVAIKGSQTNGHQYLAQVIEKGTKVIVVEDWFETDAEDIIQIQVKNSAKALAIIAGNFFNNPSRKLKLTGVTGTNGKSTIVSLLKQMFDGLGFKTGLLSTIKNVVVDEEFISTHTTPNPVELNMLLAKMVDAGCSYAFMEVSSHAIDQERTAGLDFDIAIFTNISHDHLNYHGDMKSYIATKKRLFDNLKKSAFAIVNIDDKRGSVMVQNTKAKVITYALQTMADYKGKILEQDLIGTMLKINSSEVHSRIVGRFNAENLLAVYACGDLFDIAEFELLTQISVLKPAEGRFELIYDKKKGISALVDYAHTPDALKKVLETIVETKNRAAKIITVIGCGGDRDKTKRPKMARIGAGFSDQLILTSDNPRTENPARILEEMEAGLEEKDNVLVIEDRKQAIKTACRLATNGDIILVAGKGHEKYQEINGVKIPFDDKEILKEELKI
jgi:UDP-N-acetylmuramoyl-L-alanyl-D-glutamate--2,6-diaminopimelate ligase